MNEEKGIAGMEPEPEITEKSPAADDEQLNDVNLVDFGGSDDHWDPMNRAPFSRWLHVAFVSFMAFVMALGDVAFAPGVPVLLTEFNVSVNSPLSTLVISIYALGSIAGNLLGPPLSEWQGRLPVLHISNTLFLIFLVACAVSPNINTLISFRFLSGTFGSVCYTMGGPIIGDIFPQEQRGLATAFFVSGQLIGPVVGPIIGGFLAQAKGWRWIFWLMAILWGAVFVPSVLLMRESYRPIVLRQKVKFLQKSTGNLDLYSKFDTKDGESIWTNFVQSLIRPTKMFIFLPMVTSIAIYLALIYGYLYILFTRLNEIYRDDYHFSSGDIGLTYIGLGVGAFSGSVFCGVTSDWWMEKASAGGEKKPEYRLPPLVLGTFFIPAGLLLYGWAAHFHLHWIVPLIGTALVGFGIFSSILPATTYLIDSFPLHSASAIAVTEILLAISGSLLPLAGPSLYANLGLGWGNSLLAFLAIAFAPLPWILLIYGERIRKSKRSQIQL